MITDADSAVTARVTPSGATGVVEPDVGNPNDLQLDFLERGARIAEGQMVVTAGFSTGDLGSIFPPGIPIGKITRATVEEQQAYQRVHLEPFADLRDMDFVKVLTTHSGGEQRMILTPGIIARLAVLGALVAVAQVVCFSKMDIFGTSPDVALLVVISVGLLGGSLSGAVTGFSIGLLIDCLLLETMGAFALTMLSVGYVAGRYRETLGRPTRVAVALLGGSLTLLGALVIAAIQIGTGIDANVSFLVVRDALVKSLIGALLAIPVLLVVRLVVRSALVDERRAARPTPAPRPVESG